MNQLSHKARSILQAGRHGDDPTPADRERIRKGLARAIAAGGVIGTTAAAGSAAAASGSAAAAGTTLALGTLGKVIASVAVLGCVVTGAVVWQSPSEKPATAVSLAPLTPKVAAVSAPSEPATVEIPTAPMDEAAQPLPAKISTKPGTGPIPASTEPSVQSAQDVDTLMAETKHLRQVQGALKDGDPDRALRLLDEQSATYTNGALAEERAAARVFALCNAGRIAEAEAARERFLRDSPRSPLADRVRAGCTSPSTP